MSTGQNQPFRPAGTATLAASTSSAALSLVGGGGSVVVYNSSTGIAFVRLGAASGMTALVTDYPVPPGARAVMDGGPFVSYAAAILSAGTGNVYFTLGDGSAF